MPQFSVKPTRLDPYKNCKFWVKGPDRRRLYRGLAFRQILGRLFEPLATSRGSISQRLPERVGPRRPALKSLAAPGARGSSAASGLDSSHYRGCLNRSEVNDDPSPRDLGFSPDVRLNREPSSASTTRSQPLGSHSGGHPDRETASGAARCGGFVAQRNSSPISMEPQRLSGLGGLRPRPGHKASCH